MILPMSANLDENKPRVVVDLTQMLAEVPSRLTRIETLIETMRADIGKIEHGLDGVRGDVKELRSEIRTDFRWFLGLLIPCLGALLAKAFHWIG
jgi:hypothetical protein